MILILAILLGLIPAAIAKSKGRSFGWWWLYGSLLFIIALPHILLVGAAGLTKCPHCAEMIKEEARLCRFCNKEISPLPPMPGVWETLFRIKGD